MLDLDSSRWWELTHAYGSAEDVPGMLRRVRTALSAETEADEDAEDAEDESSGPLATAWFELASALCPGGEVQPAAYAAVPHLVSLASEQPAGVRAELLLLVARVEAGRHRPGAPAIPPDLEPAYRAALSRVPPLVTARVGALDASTAQLTAAILLITTGHPRLGMAVLELAEEVQCPACQATFPQPGWDLGASDA
jgi:hypothetical protein